MKSEIKLIGEIGFKDIKVKVYNDSYTKDDTISCVWRMRNPDSSYTGIMFMNWETGKVTYPDDAVIPIQNDEDKEMLPNFIVTGCDKIDDRFISLTNSYLIKEYKRRNPKNIWRENQINILVN